MKTSPSRLAGAPPEIRTKNLLNACQVLYRYANLLNMLEFMSLWCSIILIKVTDHLQC
jgi:hypothetical protein